MRAAAVLPRCRDLRARLRRSRPSSNAIGIDLMLDDAAVGSRTSSRLRSRAQLLRELSPVVPSRVRDMRSHESMRIDSSSIASSAAVPLLICPEALLMRMSSCRVAAEAVANPRAPGDALRDILLPQPYSS